MTVEQILEAKRSVTPKVQPDVRVSDVIEILGNEDVGALIVSSDGRTIDGIISERDVVRGLQMFGPDVLSHAVRDLMTSEVFTCTADDPVGGVMALMDEKNIRHVPVVDDDRLAGFISIKDIIKFRLNEVQTEAEAMKSYINGLTD